MSDSTAARRNARSQSAKETSATYTLVNGSIGDPGLFVDYPGRHDAFLFDAGDNSRLDSKRLGDLCWLFISHQHMDHFVGFDRIFRANLDCEKTLSIVGPAGTINHIYRRITSYEHSWFPFQKLALHIKEVAGDKLHETLLRFEDRLPEPEIATSRWRGPKVYEDDRLTVEAVAVDHTVPCLAFAVVEKAGWVPDAAKLNRGVLRTGAWVEQVRKLLNASTAAETIVDVQGGRYLLGHLAEQYFRQTDAVRIAYVTDTLWSESVKPTLVKLARRARRLYCDSSYLAKDRDRAEKYKHMTAGEAAELAKAANVRELVPIHYSGRYHGRFHELVEEARAKFANVAPDLQGVT
jgi:ribonuclease Z